MKTTDHSPSYCPRCLVRLDPSTDLHTEGTPEPGDFTVCAYCGEMLRFREGFKLSVVTDADLAEAGKETRLELEKAQKAVEMINERIINRGKSG